MSHLAARPKYFRHKDELLQYFNGSNQHYKDKNKRLAKLPVGAEEIDVEDDLRDTHPYDVEDFKEAFENSYGHKIATRDMKKLIENAENSGVLEYYGYTRYNFTVRWLEKFR